MTIAILTLILLGYIKITGKTLPGVEKRLNKVKNAKKNTAVLAKAEPEIKKIEIEKFNELSFKKLNNNTFLYKMPNSLNKVYSGSLKI